MIYLRRVLRLRHEPRASVPLADQHVNNSAISNHSAEEYRAQQHDEPLQSAPPSNLLSQIRRILAGSRKRQLQRPLQGTFLENKNSLSSDKTRSGHKDPQGSSRTTRDPLLCSCGSSWLRSSLPQTISKRKIETEREKSRGEKEGGTSYPPPPSSPHRMVTGWRKTRNPCDHQVSRWTQHQKEKPKEKKKKRKRIGRSRLARPLWATS